MSDQLKTLLLRCKEIQSINERVEKLIELIKLHSTYLPFYFELANSYKDLKDDFHLEKTYSSALKIRPNNKRLLKGMLNLRFKSKKMDACEALINQILDINPDDAQVLLKKGLLLIHQDEKLEAIHCLKKVVNINPKNIQGRIQLSKLYKQNGELLNATNQLETLLSFHKENHVGLFELAQIKESSNQLNEAYDLFNKVISINPKWARGYCGLAQFFSNRGDHKQALRTLANAKSKNLDNVRAVYNKMISINLHIGNIDYAKVLLEELLSENPKDIQAQITLAKVYKEGGDFKKALKILDNISNINEDKKKVVEGVKAVINFLEYNYDAVEASYRKIITNSDNIYNERIRLALILLLKGKIQEADEQLEIATKEIEQENSSKKVIIPLISHSAKVINAVKTNPRALLKIQEAHQLNKKDRLLEYASILKKDPTYFGAALYVSNDIREQGILSEWRQNIKVNDSNIKIPKSIVQYWDDVQVPKEINNICRTWRRMNPSYDYRLFSRKTALEFIKESYTEKEVNAFENCEHPAMQADFFRLAYLNKNGGFYADADDKCLVSLEDLSNIGAELIVKLGDFGCFGNNFLACVPDNLFINYAFTQGVENLNSYYNEGPWFKLGPGHLTTSICYKLIPFLNEKDFNKWPKLYALTQSKARKIFAQHLPLSYKKTDKSWFNQAYKRKINGTKK